MPNVSDLDNVTVRDRYVGGSPVDSQNGSNIDPGGLGSAAYEDSSAFAASAHTHVLADVTDAGSAAGSDVEDFVETARSGDATLVGGTVTVSEASVGSGTLVFLSRRDVGSGVAGVLTYTTNPGVGFTIDSDNALDVSVVSWLLVG